ncbi:hypothetical protein ACHHYP_03191 [Achlya hypogyna]|uniref:Uncharacterized protein n=1 Tax=Achlya hypogyna TaxID=1202772 RepID=A0A1V9Z4A2_ACHHY|nr:hypothetical protein ACHHYP_03191 [Achlya hypogyna]
MAKASDGDALEDFVLSAWSCGEETLGVASVWPERSKARPAKPPSAPEPKPIDDACSQPSPPRPSSLVDAGRLQMYKIAVPRTYPAVLTPRSQASRSTSVWLPSHDWSTTITKVDFGADTIPDAAVPNQESNIPARAAAKPIKSSKKTLQELHPGLNRVWPLN